MKRRAPAPGGGRRLLSAGSAAAAAVVVLALASAAAPATAASSPTPGTGAWSRTQHLARTFADPSGPLTVDERDVTVSVDKTRELRGRERVQISWSGAHPSAARAVNPFGEGGLLQEYPVVIMQCRGLDDPSLPVAQQLRPETCWTSTRMQRSAGTADRVAVWRHDAYATEAARAQVTGLLPYPSSCPPTAGLSVHLTPFVAAKGTSYPACDATSMPPEAAVGATFPPAEIAAFTDLDGRGSTSFEVRTDVENESLGCSNTVACSIVVVPIMGVSCVDADPECTKTGRFLEGSSNFAGEGVDDAVSPAYWWAASNWRGRFSVPISFGLPPNACDLLDPRAPVGFFGSELMAQASVQWAPAYCLRKDRFKFQHNVMPDKAAFGLMTSKNAAAAFVSAGRAAPAGTKVAYAPTAVTGFGIAYAVDKPGNAGEQEQLRLTPRLLAKLLTESYAASDLGRQRPGLASNPLSINRDPEFVALNPGLDSIEREASATLLSLSNSSDVITTLTSYIAADPEAMAFVSGKPDPWGMTVNPAYRNLPLPTDQIPILDTFVPKSALECRLQNPTPYLPLVAAPVSSLRTVATAVLDAWPNVQTKCDRSTTSDPWKLGRVDRQGIGSRFMLGLVSLGDASRFGLRTASLQTSVRSTAPTRFTDATGRTFVAPTRESLAAAVALGKQSAPMAPFTWTQEQVRRAGNAYPGTQIVYTAALLSGLTKTTAAEVASFITVSSSEGQRTGPGNGQLPEGFLPITSSGPTAALRTSAIAVAGAIRAQKALSSGSSVPGSDSPPGAVGGPSAGGTTPAAGSGVVGGTQVGGDTTGVAGAPPGGPAGAAPPPAGPGASAPARAPSRVAAPGVVMAAAVPTRTVTSKVGSTLLPVLLIIGPLAGLLAAGALGLRRGRRMP
ncbi:hypothetical protein [Terrabacter carboxydivorans]|uniref:Uncharacterized protein n=1 Tax=Terrabacter carboxydivorans TaxID=619730 RepID=A0ABP5ZLW2_9MICO